MSDSDDVNKNNLINSVMNNKKRISVVLVVVLLTVIGGFIVIENPAILDTTDSEPDVEPEPEPEETDPETNQDDEENLDSVEDEESRSEEPDKTVERGVTFELYDNTSEEKINLRINDIQVGDSWVVNDSNTLVKSTIVVSNKSSESYQEIEPNTKITLEEGSYDIYVNYPRYKIKTTSITISEESPNQIKRDIMLNPRTFKSAPDCNVRYFGDGSREDPLEVSNIYELQCINAQGVESTYSQTSTIDGSVTKNWNDGAGFRPIGYYSDSERGVGQPFIGDYYGNGYTINNLYINRADDLNVGLFGFITKNRTFGSPEPNNGPQIQGITLENATITGKSNVGGIIGLGTPLAYNSNYITDNSVSGSISGNRSFSDEYGACYDADPDAQYYEELVFQNGGIDCVDGE